MCILEWKDPRFVFSKHQISEYTITHINDHDVIDNRVAPLFRNVTSYRRLITTGDTLRLSPTDRKVEAKVKRHETQLRQLDTM